MAIFSLGGEFRYESTSDMDDNSDMGGIETQQYHTQRESSVNANGNLSVENDKMVTHAKTINLDTSLTSSSLDKVIDVIKKHSPPLSNGDLPQKSRPHTQQYIEELLEENDSTNAKRWIPIQMELRMTPFDLDHEAEIHWPNEQDAIRKGPSTMTIKKEITCELKAKHKSLKDIFNDPQWHKKHGGSSPKHYNPHGVIDAVNSSKDKRRPEKHDRGKDGIVFPDVYSDQLYSKLVFPFVSADSASSLAFIAYNRQGDCIMNFNMVKWNGGNVDLADMTRDIPFLEHLFRRNGADSYSDQGDDASMIQKALDHVSQITEQSAISTSVVPKGILVGRLSGPFSQRLDSIK
ncbi:hypothetical protein BGX20_008000 [Mortierella sp. AD010]|nr:hypothetical protein BGX20_008000 [Mortierella sp. AD010]